MANLTQDQKDYLLGLRSGNIDQSILIIRDRLTSDHTTDFNNFKEFLRVMGHPSPTDEDLLLRITRKNFLRMLFYANDRDRNCLVLQSCFGFDTPPRKEPISTEPLIEETVAVGRVVLINKGNFQEKVGRSDDDFFREDSDTVFRNALDEFEFFQNMNLDNQLTIDQARQFINNFITMYPKDRQNALENPFIHGFLLPVRALINLFTSPIEPLAQVDTLTFRWGLTRFNEPAEIGNFSLVIGTGDLSTGPVIEFRTENIVGTGEGDCPPRSGCPIGS